MLWGSVRVVNAVAARQNRGDLRKAVIPLEVPELRRGDPVLIVGDADPGKAHPELEQLLGMVIGERFQDDGAHHAEDGRGGSDPPPPGPVRRRSQTPGCAAGLETRSGCLAKQIPWGSLEHNLANSMNTMDSRRSYQRGLTDRLRQYRGLLLDHIPSEFIEIAAIDVTFSGFKSSLYRKRSLRTAPAP